MARVLGEIAELSESFLQWGNLIGNAERICGAEQLSTARARLLHETGHYFHNKYYFFAIKGNSWRNG
jgi:hypothetical protein